MSKLHHDEKELFAPIPSITAAPPAPDRDDEPRKKPAPRQDKPDHYFLMLNGEIENVYATAVDAVKGLKDVPAHRLDDVYLQDEGGSRMASKKLVDAPLERPTTSGVGTVNPRQDIVLELSEEMRHDLAAEGFDPDRSSELELQIEEQIDAKLAQLEPSTWREALDLDKPAPAAPEAEKEPTAAVGQPASKPPVNELRAAMARFDEVREKIVAEKGEPEWRRMLKEATDEVQGRPAISSFMEQAASWRQQLQPAVAPESQSTAQPLPGAAEPDVT